MASVGQITAAITADFTEFSRQAVNTLTGVIALFDKAGKSAGEAFATAAERAARVSPHIEANPAAAAAAGALAGNAYTQAFAKTAKTDPGAFDGLFEGLAAAGRTAGGGVNAASSSLSTFTGLLGPATSQIALLAAAFAVLAPAVAVAGSALTALVTGGLLLLPALLGAAALAIGPLLLGAQQLKDAFGGLTQPFDDLKKTVGDTLVAGLGPQIQQLATTLLPTLQTALTTAAGGLNTLFKGIATALADPVLQQGIKDLAVGLSGALTALAPAMGPLAAAFGRLLTAAAPFITLLGEKGAAAIGKFADWVAKAAADGTLERMFNDVFAIAGALAPILTEITGLFLQMWNAGGKEVFLQLMGQVLDLVRQLSDFLKTDEGQETFQRFLAVLPMLLTAVSIGLQILITLTQAQASAFNTFRAGIQLVLAGLQWLGDKFNWAAAHLAEFFERAIGFVTSLPGRIVGVLSGLYSMVTGVFSRAFNGIVGAISGGVNSAIGFARELPGKFIDAIGDLGTKIWNAIKGGLESVVTKAKGVLSKIPGGNLVSGALSGISGLFNSPAVATLAFAGGPPAAGRTVFAGPSMAAPRPIIQIVAPGRRAVSEPAVYAPITVNTIAADPETVAYKVTARLARLAAGRI